MRITRFAIALVLLGASRMYAHCDSLDGPVVKAARHALETGEIENAAIWVRPDAEPELKAAFGRARAIRGANRQTQELADTYFLETVVRLHRAGEGAPYTGLKPAGRDPGPAIAEADRALESGSADALVNAVTRNITPGIRMRLEKAKAARQAAPASVQAGRNFVAAYVDLMHYVEGVHQAASRGDGGHEHEH